MIQTCLEEGKEKDGHDSLALWHRKNPYLIQVSFILKERLCSPQSFPIKPGIQSPVCDFTIVQSSFAFLKREIDLFGFGTA